MSAILRYLVYQIGLAGTQRRAERECAESRSIPETCAEIDNIVVDNPRARNSVPLQRGTGGTMSPLESKRRGAGGGKEYVRGGYVRRITLALAQSPRLARWSGTSNIALSRGPRCRFRAHFIL